MVKVKERRCGSAGFVGEMSHLNPLHCPTRRELSASPRFPSPPRFKFLPLPGTEYQNLDANGIGGDFPMQNTTRNASSVQFSVPSKDPPLALPWVDDLTWESQMHSFETEAYSAVLRAFHAQSDRLTWEREALISELRKELRVSDVEHREFLLKVKSEDSVKMIREWYDNVAGRHRVLSNTTNAPLKKQKVAHVPVSSSPHCLPCRPSTAATVFPLAGNLGQGLKPAALTRQPLSIVKDKSSLVVKMKKDLSNVGTETSNRGGDLVQIRATDKLIAEIETILRENPNPWQVQKVKLLLGEHERSIRVALQKLADVSIEDDSSDHLH